MATAAENGAHKTIALFDVDGTLTVPRKARPYREHLGSIAAYQNHGVRNCWRMLAYTSHIEGHAFERS